MSTETNNVDVAPVDAAPAPAAPAEATPSAAAPAPSAAAPVAAPKVQSYDEAFPGLGGGPAPTQAAVSWFNNPMKSIKSSTTSTTFQIPFEQRRFRPGAATEFGKGTAGDRGKAECLKIMNETKVGFRLNVLIAWLVWLSGEFWERQGASFLEKKSRVTFSVLMTSYLTEHLLFHDDLELRQ